LESNVQSKYRLYRAELIDEPSGQILIQGGQFSFAGSDYAIEFPQPFKSIPFVEIINIRGYDISYVPRIKSRTLHQVVLVRTGFGGLIPEKYQVYRWVARGEPLIPLEIEAKDK